MARGLKTGGGSRKGRPNKRKADFRAALQAYAEEKHVDPHYWMIDLIADPDADIGHKVQCAKEVAQYLQPKLKAMDLEISGNPEKPLVVHIRRGHG